MENIQTSIPEINEVKSILGSGTSFNFEIPRIVENLKLEDQLKKIEIDDKYDNSKSSTTILVIDDDLTVHDLIRRQIGDKGYKIISAMNGKEGIELAKKHKPNVITLDVLMPEMDGW